MKSEAPDKPNRMAEAPVGELLKYCATDALLEHKLAMIQARELGVKL